MAGHAAAQGSALVARRAAKAHALECARAEEQAQHGRRIVGVVTGRARFGRHVTGSGGQEVDERRRERRSHGKRAVDIREYLARPSLPDRPTAVVGHSRLDERADPAGEAEVDLHVVADLVGDQRRIGQVLDLKPRNAEHGNRQHLDGLGRRAPQLIDRSSAYSAAKRLWRSSVKAGSTRR